MRKLPGYILFLALTLCAQAQTSVWWYPMGPMESSRYQSAPTIDTATPVIRWHSTALRNSPVVLVGALRPDSAGAQQIYGQIGNEIRVLQSEGWLDTALPISSLFLSSPDASIRLTGLFDSEAPTPDARGAANTIGVGITQTETGTRVPIYGLLLDPMLGSKRELWIERLNQTTGPNAIASVYPIAHYSPPGVRGPVALALVSQDSYVGCSGCDTMVNGLRYYALDTPAVFEYPLWSYVVAPKTYVQPPALAVDEEDQPTLLVAITMSSYTFTPPVIARQTARAQTLETSSDQVYTYVLRSSPVIDAPAEAQRIRFEGTTVGESHSYVVTLRSPPANTEQRYRVITENHDDQRPGVARIYLRSYNQALQFGLYQDSAAFGRSLAWSIVEADLDGTDQSTGRFLTPNAGREIVGMRRRLDGQPLDSNRIYSFRDGRALRLYADQAFTGELLAAGDLVADELDKDELVVSDGSSIMILRFRRFDAGEAKLNPPNYFDTVAAYSLRGTIRRAAIADVEGDGSNDLIVVTDEGTYLIGRPHPMPLGSVRVDRSAICSRDSIIVSWHRAVGGGGAGMRVDLEHVASSTTTQVESAYMPDGSQRYVFHASGLAPGRYRLRITDADVASVSAASDEFVIQEPSIAPFSAPSADAYTPVSIDVAAPCADSLVLEYSFDNSVWTGVSNPFAVRGDTTTIDFPMPCPSDGHCAATSEQTIFFRFRTSDGTIVSQVRPGRVTVAQSAVASAPAADGGTRRRRLSWSSNAFACDSLAIALSLDDGTTWSDVGAVAVETGFVEVDVDGELEQPVVARLCCISGCGTGLARFTASEIGDADFIAPNPFDPSEEATASIIYRLKQSGTVTITIHDVSRALVQTVMAGESQRSGLHRATWDGRNSRGDIVADGTYICVIASSGGDRIALPLSVAKR